MGVDTQFRLASSNKMFTAVAILQLMQTGRLSLDETIGKYLSDYPNKAVANTVTVRQLLSHTSGLGDFFGDDFEHSSASLKTLDDYVQRFARMHRSSRRAARTAIPTMATSYWDASSRWFRGSRTTLMWRSTSCARRA